jgi:CO/xanthine dehydrogenase Mo-binding subunit
LLTTGAAVRFQTDEYRVDGKAKVSGQAQYAADFSLPNMLWASFVPSTRAHAKIVSIDTAAARALPGVRAVLTGQDIGARYFGKRIADWPVLSIEKVRFIGEYVAAVAADTAQIAEAAANLIEVIYEDLPAVFDVDAALRHDAVILHEHPERYHVDLAVRPHFAHANIQGHHIAAIGDVEAGFAQADRIFEHAFTTPRYHGGYLEPRATLVWVDSAGVVQVISTNKAPFTLRDQFALTTGLPKESIVIHPCFIGGDFGAKGNSIEEFACYYLAAATSRPVKYVRSSSDDIRSTNVRHAAKVTVRTGLTPDGKILAQSVQAVYDGGAYAAPKRMPNLLPGPETKVPYGIPHQRHERTAVYTNTIPGCFIRAPGEVQIAFAVESSLDMIARELAIDPLEFRLLNAARAGDIDIEGFPFLEPRAVEVLETLKRESRWDAPLPPGRGRGIALSVKEIGPGKTSIKLELAATGDVNVCVGATEQGMGILTVLTRVVAVDLGLPEHRVHVARGSTDEAEVDPGVGASRTTHLNGRAVLDACRQLREALRTAAPGAVWDAAVGELLRTSAGTYAVTGYHDGDARPGEPQYNNFAGYVFEVTVDRETGAYTIDDVVFCLETGTIINPVAHRGQIDGGFMMGLGYAVSEELVLDEGRITNLSFADYKLATSADIPPLRVSIIEGTTGPGPFGARAVGEANIAAVGPALANAVDAACGVRLRQMPLTAERIYAARFPSEAGPD